MASPVGRACWAEILGGRKYRYLASLAPGAGPCGSKRRHPCRLRFRSSTSLTPMTHFVFHPQQNPFASPPSRQRKMCCFCYPVGWSLLLSPAEAPRANIPRGGGLEERDGKTGFCRGRSRAHALSFFCHCAHAPVGDSRQRSVLRSRFSTLLPACSSASHMYAETRKACMQDADGAASLS